MKVPSGCTHIWFVTNPGTVLRSTYDDETSTLVVVASRVGQEHKFTADKLTEVASTRARDLE
ncbi:MAG TPA: hypothetical protein VN934_06105 [Candidatus Tumulicola sp.]|nr:hypothetical protein [Candidatus Tumulicola sp.]